MYRYFGESTTSFCWKSKIVSYCVQSCVLCMISYNFQVFLDISSKIFSCIRLSKFFLHVEVLDKSSMAFIEKCHMLVNTTTGL